MLVGPGKDTFTVSGRRWRANDRDVRRQTRAVTISGDRDAEEILHRAAPANPAHSLVRVRDERALPAPGVDGYLSSRTERSE